MPTAIIPAEKTAFIAIVRVQSVYEADRLVDVMNNYEDIPVVIGRQLDIYEANFPYITELMNVFSSSDASLMAAGVYYKKTALSSVTNPAAIINCTYAPNGLDVSISLDLVSLMIVGKSNVNNITVAASKKLTYLYVGPGSTVNLLDSTATGACVGRVELGIQKNLGASLNAVKNGSCMGTVISPDGTNYGGFANTNPTVSCTGVTNAKCGIITHNSIQLAWVPPVSGYLFIDVNFRKSGTTAWYKATSDMGEFAADGTGYTMRGLEKDTFYDFDIATTCTNGGISHASLPQQQTNNA